MLGLKTLFGKVRKYFSYTTPYIECVRAATWPAAPQVNITSHWSVNKRAYNVSVTCQPMSLDAARLRRIHIALTELRVHQFSTVHLTTVHITHLTSPHLNQVRCELGRAL